MSRTFAKHEAPIWGDRSDFVINARLDEPDRFEQLRVRQQSDSFFEVCCIPFFLYDVALGDVVSTSPAAGFKYCLDSVVEPSGRFVFRAYFERSKQVFRGAVESELASLGALVEESSPSLIAIDANDVDHAQVVGDYLARQSQTGVLIYETGKMWLAAAVLFDPRIGVLLQAVDRPEFTLRSLDIRPEKNSRIMLVAGVAAGGEASTAGLQIAVQRISLDPKVTSTRWWPVESEDWGAWQVESSPPDPVPTLAGVQDPVHSTTCWDHHVGDDDRFIALGTDLTSTEARAE